MNKEINENPGQYNALDPKIYDKIKSKSRLLHSSVQKENFIRHNHKTDLNLPPPNWLKSEGELYGMRYTTGDLHDFSSFQIANIFPEYIGKVDIVSNAENIKNLCKISHDKKSVSILVHRIDKTFLLDEFDVEKHLTVVTNKKWDWLKKFFYNNIVKSADTKVKCITYKQNDLNGIQHKALLSKFLHHSIALDSHNDQIKNKMFYNETSPLASPVPIMIPEEIFSDGPQKHQLFNRNVLWDFEDLQMLIGTDLPVFKNGNNSSLSSRLRDMSKPLSMLTGIDYWLDNLMCDIPETELCYHINGIVQKYELIKTEDFPCLNGSIFSPQNASHNMQNILSFLKSNANKVGHTYWLIKGKNDNMPYLHDLTTVYSESFIDSPNPFTVPVARLLYRVACKLKHNPEDGKPYDPVTIIHLLNNCLKLLDKIKYPQAVTYVNYMLSDIYIAVCNNPLNNVIEDLTYLDENSATGHVVAGIASMHLDYGTFSVDVKNESISYKKENISQIPEYSATKYIIKTIDQCFYKALYYIGGSLNCLQYFKNNKDTTNELHLRQILFEKASDLYLNLGKKCFASNNYGIALKCYRRSLECQLCVTNTHVYNKLGHILENSGNCFLSIVKFWDKIEQYMSELETNEFYDVELREALISISNDCTNKDLNLIPTRLDKSYESVLSAAERSYFRALALKPNIEKKTFLNKRVGNVYNEYTGFYMSEILMSIENNVPLTLVKFKWLRKKLEHYFTLGSDIFKKIDDKPNLVMIGINLANFYRHIAGYSSKFPIDIKEVIKEENLYLKAANIYINILSELKDRTSNPKLWDIVHYELSSVQYYLSVQKYLALCRDNSNDHRECINSFMIALKYCDLENDTTNTFKYNYQAACINLGLASVYFVLYEKGIIGMKTVKAKYILLQTKVYYDKSFELFHKIKCPLESLEVLIKMILLDMRFINGIIGIEHVKHIKSIIKTLGKCDAVFLMFLGNEDILRYSPSTEPIEELSIKDESIFEMKKKYCFKVLEVNVCKLLKYMIKMAMNKTSKWLDEKEEEELKTIYHQLLRNTDGDNDYSQLMVAVKQLYRFSDN